MTDVTIQSRTARASMPLQSTGPSTKRQSVKSLTYISAEIKDSDSAKKLANTQSQIAQKVTHEKADGYFSELWESWGEDWNELTSDAEKTHSFIFKQDLRSSAVQQVGNVVDLGIDLIGSVFVNDKTKEEAHKAIKILTKTKAYQSASKELAQITGETLQTVNAFLDKNPKVKKVLLQSAHAGMEVTQEVINKVKEVAAEHPEAMRNLGAAGEIIQVIPVGKAISLGAKGGKLAVNNSIELLKRVKINAKPSTLGSNFNNIDVSLKPKPVEVLGLKNTGKLSQKEIDLAKGAGKTAEHIAARKKLSSDFYEQQGMPKAKIEGHTAGIDFNKPVEVVELPKDKVLHQYQVPDGPQGNYYTEPGVKPSSVGISSKAKDWKTGEIVERQVNPYKTNDKVKVLQSSAEKIDDTWSIPGKTVPTDGGGTQYFTMDGSRISGN
ncbi:MAG: polymorphic toxin type 46 domain-containing protein [Methylococcaceae bacterium]